MALGRSELGPFTEGVNLVDPLTKLTPHELRQCLNWRIGVRGDFYKRPGHGGYGSSPAKVNGDALVNLLLRYYKADGTKLLIAAAGGKLRKGTDGTGAWTDIDINGTGASMGAVNLADWMVYKNRLYITDGVNPQRYNGTDDIYAGHFTHAAPTLTGGTGGALTLDGVYKYFVTSVAGDMGEGPKGTEQTVDLSPTQNRVSISAMAAAPAKHEEVTKKIYRTKANGSLFYFLVEIPSATTAYTDDIADSALSVEFIPTHVPPADSRFLIVGHDERTYWFGRSGLNASLVDVSDVGFPDRIPDTSFFSVNNNDGDILTGGGLVPGGIVFFKKTSLWLLRAFGFGLINIFPREKRGAGIGTISPFSTVTTPVGLIFLSQRGEIYKFDGINLEEIGRKVASEFQNMPQSAMGLIVACYHDYRYIISYDYRGIKGYNWKTLEYDTRTGKWEGPHENGDFYNPSYYSVWDSVLDKGELYWGEAKAASGSYVYGRTEFTKLDRTSKFLSLVKSGARPGLSEAKATKIFVHAEITSDVELTATHIGESGRRTSVTLNSPTVVTNSKWNNSASNWGPDASAAKWGGRTSSILEGSFGPEASSKIASYEISDGGLATEAKMNTIELLATELPLK